MSANTPLKSNFALRMTRGAESRDAKSAGQSVEPQLRLGACVYLKMKTVCNSMASLHSSTRPQVTTRFSTHTSARRLSHTIVSSRTESPSSRTRSEPQHKSVTLQSQPKQPQNESATRQCKMSRTLREHSARKTYASTVSQTSRAITTGTASMSPGLRIRSRPRMGVTSTVRVADASGRSQWATVLWCDF